MGHYSTRHVLDVTRDLLERNDDAPLGRLPVAMDCEACHARRRVALPGGRFYLDHAHASVGQPGGWWVSRTCPVPAAVEATAAAPASPTTAGDDALLAELVEAAVR